ncbi:MAG: hypothetical protein ACFFBR_08390 [Promethearchaeota archaeon]
MKQRIHVQKEKWHKFDGLTPVRKGPSPLRLINYRAFIIPIIMMVIGGLIWSLTAFYQPWNLQLILLGQIIFMIGMFVAIILGLWIMTIVRMPVR